jgi:membrane-associated HD superfamily phosphohydrolase
LGPIGSILELVNDTLTATSNAAETASEITGLFKNEIDKFNEIKGKIDSWLEKLNSVSRSYDQYQNSSGLSSLNNLNTSQQNMNTNTSTVEPNRSNFTSAVAPSIASMSMSGGKNSMNRLKHIQKGGKMAAKRTKKSINEFLNSGIKSSQILKKLKSKTRRRVK